MWRARICIWPGRSTKGESREGRQCRQGGGQSGGEVWRLLREVPRRIPGRRPEPTSGAPPNLLPGPERRTCRLYEAGGGSSDRQGTWPALGRDLGGGAIELGLVFGRESIFKISHTKS